MRRSSDSQLHPASKRLLLDVFAGRLHPVTSAAISLGLDCFEPFDLDGDAAHNILDDSVFEALLRLCWSGIVALIMLAPPCKEYSRLKLCPGGPKALRTPQHMDGVPGSSTTVVEPCSEQWSPKGAWAFGSSHHQPCPGWKRLTSRCYAITSVPLCG